ncbi:MAG: hypothetical protein E2598_07505 [Sphingobium sp.]|nr:hypothetical protein [Sphingobium sp.]
MDQVIRPKNAVMLFKLETVEGVDAVPTIANAFPFEADGYSYNNPFSEETSNEATGSLVAGAPMIVGQPAQITIRFRMKGANIAYSASVKPPHHDLLAACGMRGVFTASVSAAALAAGTVTSATLGAAFAATAQAYRGMPLVLSNGRTTFISDYTAGKVATLADKFDAPLDTSVTASIPDNWTYAGTSPKDAAARIADHPSGTLYLYEDGTLQKWTGCRGILTEWSGDTAKPGFMTVQMVGVFAGAVDAPVPDVSVAAHLAPIVVQGVNRPDPAFSVNRHPLPIDNWSIANGTEQESPADPNTNYGFGASILGGRAPRLECNPKKTLYAVRDIIADIQASKQYPGKISAPGSAYNRWGITLPQLTPASAEPGQSGSLRVEQQRYAMTSTGKDAYGRDGEAILAFW